MSGDVLTGEPHQCCEWHNCVGESGGSRQSEEQRHTVDASGPRRPLVL
jgi:hypothetical protein